MAAPEDLDFEKHEIDIGPGGRQTVLAGFLLGGAIADLAVVDLDESEDRRLRLFAHADGTWEQRLETTLGRGVRFVDVANIDGRDRLITYGRARLSWFDPETVTERALVEVTSDFRPPPRGEIPHIDITRDVNGDGREDLVVPHRHGFRIFVQESGGAFADPVEIGPASGGERVYGADGYRYKPWTEGGRVHEIDYDHDGRPDLVYWNGDHFAVHLQEASGLFAETAETFTTEVAFDTDQMATLAAPGEARRRRANQGLEGDLTGRVLHSLRDVDGDGVGDLVLFSLAGGSLMKMRSAVEVHFGSPAANGGTEFAPEAGSGVRSRGIPFGMEQHDLGGDGTLDLMLTNIEVGIFKAAYMILDALFTRSVSLDLDFYRLDDGAYPEKPTVSRRIRADFPPGEAGGKAAFFPVVLIADVTGDGRSDLLVGRSEKELQIFAGVPEKGLFADEPQRVAVTMPSDEEYTWLADLDRDGGQDLVMHHPSATGRDRVTMLFWR